MALLDSPDKFLNDSREPDTKHYRLKPWKQRQQSLKYSNELTVTGHCRNCGNTYTGRLEDERHWFTNHPCGGRG